MKQEQRDSDIDRDLSHLMGLLLYLLVVGVALVLAVLHAIVEQLRVL